MKMEGFRPLWNCFNYPASQKAGLGCGFITRRVCVFLPSRIAFTIGPLNKNRPLFNSQLLIDLLVQSEKGGFHNSILFLDEK